MSDDFEMTGTSISDYMTIFEQVENNTYTKILDFSDLAVLSYLDQNPDAIRSIRMMGEESFREVDGQIQLNAKAVDISIEDRSLIKTVSKEKNPILVEGGVYDTISGQAERLFLTGNTLYEKTLFTKLGLSGIPKGVARDMAIASACNELMDETPLTLVYRTRGGVKKAVSVFGKSYKTPPSAREFTKACYISGFYNVVYWSINQKLRSCYVEFLADQNETFHYRPGLVFTCSDTGYQSPVIQLVWREQQSAPDRFIIQEKVMLNDASYDSLVDAIKQATSSLRDTREKMKNGILTESLRAAIESEITDASGYNLFLKDFKQQIAQDKSQDYMYYIDRIAGIMQKDIIKEITLRSPGAKIREVCGAPFRAISKIA